MAELQLPVCSDMDPAGCNPRLSATSQKRYLPEAPGGQLNRLRNNTKQQRFSRDKLADLHIQKRQQSFYSQPSESTRGVLEKAEFSSAGASNWYFKAQESTLPAHWRAKRKEGVDRAYPLKPIFQHNDENAPLPISSQAGCLAEKEKGNPSGNIDPDKKGRSHALKSQHVRAAPISPIVQSKISVSHLRAEPGYIQKLEAEGRNLGEKIRQKEVLLKQKLTRAEEEFRKIQRGKQQARPNGRKEQGKLRMPERKPEEIHQGSAKFTTQQHICQHTRVSECLTASLGVAGSPLGLTVERLKKQRLVASNSKNRENGLASSSPELAPLRGQNAPPSTPIEQPGCAVAEATYLYMENPSKEEELGQCHICERRLYHSRLEKHICICSKNHGSKRGVFDSSKARAKGTELETYHLLKGFGSSQRNLSSPSSETSKQSTDISKQCDWRQKHECFIRAQRRAREVQRIISKGGKASDVPPAPAMENPDYKLCPYCTRHFAPKVAERHIPKCKDIKNRPPPPQQKRRC